MNAILVDGGVLTVLLLCLRLAWLKGADSQKSCSTAVTEVPKSSCTGENVVIQLEFKYQPIVKRITIMDIILKADAATKVEEIVARTKFGIADQVPQLTVTNSDESLVTVVLAADQKTISFTPAGQGKVGTAVVVITDAVDNVSASVNVIITEAPIVSLELDDVPVVAPVEVVVPPVAAEPVPEVAPVVEAPVATQEPAPTEATPVAETPVEVPAQAEPAAVAPEAPAAQ